jgi:hypothetical protein
MAYKVYGKWRVSIPALPIQTSTGPGTSLKLQHLGSAGLDSCLHAGPYEPYFRDFTQSLQKKLGIPQIRQRSIPFASFPVHRHLNFLSFQAKLCERLKA